jgi:hypothetical protein
MEEGSGGNELDSQPNLLTILGFIGDVHFSGGDIGFTAGNQQFTFRDMTFDNVEYEVLPFRAKFTKVL